MSINNENSYQRNIENNVISIINNNIICQYNVMYNGLMASNVKMT